VNYMNTDPESMPINVDSEILGCTNTNSHEYEETDWN